MNSLCVLSLSLGTWDLSFSFQHVVSLLQHVGSLVVAYWIKIPDQGLNPGPLHWKRWILTTGPPGKSHEVFQSGQLEDTICGFGGAPSTILILSDGSFPDFRQLSHMRAPISIALNILRELFIDLWVSACIAFFFFCPTNSSHTVLPEVKFISSSLEARWILLPIVQSENSLKLE